MIEKTLQNISIITNHFHYLYEILLLLFIKCGNILIARVLEIKHRAPHYQGTFC